MKLKPIKVPKKNQITPDEVYAEFSCSLIKRNRRGNQKIVNESVNISASAINDKIVFAVQGIGVAFAINMSEILSVIKVASQAASELMAEREDNDVREREETHTKPDETGC